MRNIIRIALLASLTVAGCGGGGGDTASGSDDETSGNDTAYAEETSDEPEPEPEPTGPGQLQITNVIGTDEADAGGTVQILSARGEVVAEGNSGQTFTVPAGDYRVTGQITDASLLVDTPTHEMDRMVTVPPGETTTQQHRFPVSRIQIEVRRRNRPVARWSLRLTREGHDNTGEITLEPSSSHIPITPGRYTGMLTTGSQEVEVSGLIFQGGATMTVPVAIE